MALINCPKCGKPISDKAVKCPHCGIMLDEIKNETSKSNTAEEIKNNLTEKEQVITPNVGGTTKNEEKAVNTTKLTDALIVVASLLGVISAFVPFFFDVYGVVTEQPIPPLISAQNTPLFLAAKCTSIIGGILCLGVFVYGIVRIIKKVQPSWLLVVFSIIFAIISSFGTFEIAYYASSSFRKIYMAKVDTARGTYEWVSKEDNTTTVVSLFYYGYVEYHGKEGYVKDIFYDYNKDKLGVVINVQGEDSIMWFDADMKNVETASGKVSVKKISNSTSTVEEWHAKKQKIEKQKKLEEFKNFRTMDLSAFMLHGKVKEMSEYIDYSDYSSFEKVTFDETGRLIKFIRGNTYYGSDELEITHDGNTLTVYTPETDNSTEYVIKENRLVRLEQFQYYEVYSHYNSNNWPQISTCYEYNSEKDVTYKKTYSITYSDLDKYGNWRKSLRKGNDNEYCYRRDITYYPVE